MEFNTFVMKESGYNIIMMSTLSGLTVPEGQKEEIIMLNWEVVKYKYPGFFANNYR